MDIYKYHDPADFIAALLKEKREKNPSFSMRALAQRCGFNNVGYLSMIINRKRPMSLASAKKICDGLGFDANATKYLETMVLFSTAKAPSQRELFAEQLESLRPQPQNKNILTEDRLRIFSHWYHIVIMEMTLACDFQENPYWIAGKLQNRISAFQGEQALTRLIQHGYLKRDANGNLCKSETQTASSDEIPSTHLRNLHSEFIEEALHSVNSHALKDRDITARIVVTNPEKLALAKKKIRDFRSELAAFLETPGGTQVCTLNVQLVNHFAEHCPPG